MDLPKTKHVPRRGAKIPSYSAKVHHPGIPGSFVFRKNGKVRLDNVLKQFCLKNQCIAVFEVKVNLHNVNPTKIDYKASDKGLSINSMKDIFRKFDIVVPYPDTTNFTLSIPSDNELEATFHNGILSCKIPIVECKIKPVLAALNPSKKKKSPKKPKKTIAAKTKHAQKRKLNEINTSDQPKSQSSDAATKEFKTKAAKKRRLNPTESDATVIESTEETKTAEPNPTDSTTVAAKKTPEVSGMSQFEQFALADSIVDQLQDKHKLSRQKERQKNDELQELKQMRSEKQLKKKERQDAARQRFLQKRGKKHKKQRHEKTEMKKFEEKPKTVRFK